MIKDGIKPSRILVFTFTKKAAQELKERITSAIGPDADKMTVCTYHSFCGKILRKFPEYTGRTRNFSIYDEDEKVALVKKIQKNF
ncbi:UvrD-helicase domain-containing protein, partial [Acinetobacter sp. 163]|nr:UvrD-helicase domain-containing protein [Acinetobacter sp. 163]